LSDLGPGSALGRYQILGMLGRGGMANVYKAFQPALERVVALKVIRGALTDDPEFVERFRREARAIARLAHPNIVQVFDFDEIDGRSVLAMQFLDGGTLKEHVATLAASGKRMERADIARVIRGAADALDYAHRQGVIHRDIKPSNIMLTDGRAVVTDFGIAKILEQATQMTQTGVGVGTPDYMSPEQGMGSAVDARSDVYSLAVVAYELLAGQLPYAADTPMAIVLKHIRDPLPLPSSIDPTLRGSIEVVLLKALAKVPADRYPSAGEFAAALERAVAQSDASIMPTVLPSRRAAIGVSGLSLPLPILGAALALLVGGGAVAAAVATRATTMPPTSTQPAAPGGTSTQLPASISTATPTALPSVASVGAPTTPPVPARTVAPSSRTPTPPSANDLRVSGRVTSATTGVAVADVRVDILDAGTGTTSWGATSDQSGNYIVFAPPGTYRVRFTPPSSAPYAPQNWDGQPTNRTAAVLDLRSGPADGVNAALVTGFLVNGAITHQGDGSAAAGANVYFQDSSRGGVGWSKADGSGKFAIHLTNGAYQLTFAPSDIPTTFAPQPTKTINVNNADVTGVNGQIP